MVLLFMISTHNNIIIRNHMHRMLQIKAWGKDGIRIRSTQNSEIGELSGALLEPEATNVKVYNEGDKTIFVNGKIKAILHNNGRI